MEAKSIFFFTEVYPRGFGEEWKTSEILALASVFDRVFVIPFREDISGVAVNPEIFPSNVFFLEPLIPINGFDVRGITTLYAFNWKKIRCTYFLLKELIHNWKAIRGSYNNKLKFIYHKQVVYGLIGSKRLNLILDKIKVNDVLYSFWGYGFASLVPFIAGSKLRPAKLVVRFHGTDLYEEKNEGYIVGRKLLIKHISCSLAVSEYGVSYIQSKYPKLVDKIYLSRLGAPAPKFTKSTPSDDLFRIVSCSRIVPVKRLHLIGDALGKWEFENFEWVHIGDGPMRTEIEELIPDAKKSKIRFLGHLTPSQVKEYYANNFVNVFVNVSESEGLPVSIMEALSHGVPVIATDVGGTAEIVLNDKNGYLLPVGFEIERLQACLRLIYDSDQTKRKEMREFSRIIFNEKVNSDVNSRNVAKLLVTL